MKALINVLYILLLISPLVKGQSQVKDSQEFEGVIYYDVSYQPTQNQLPSSYFEETRGNKLHYYYKKGNILRVYLNESDTVRVEAFLAQNNRLYARFMDSDTVYWYSAAEMYASLIESGKGKSEKIREEMCESYFVKMKLPLQGQAASKDITISYHYYFGESLKIDKNHFKNYNEGFFNKIVDFSQALPVKTQTIGNLYTDITTELVKAQKTTLNESTFIPCASCTKVKM